MTYDEECDEVPGFWLTVLALLAVWIFRKPAVTHERATELEPVTTVIFSDDAEPVVISHGKPPK